MNIGNLLPRSTLRKEFFSGGGAVEQDEEKVFKRDEVLFSGMRRMEAKDGMNNKRKAFAQSFAWKPWIKKFPRSFCFKMKSIFYAKCAAVRVERVGILLKAVCAQHPSAPEENKFCSTENSLGGSFSSQWKEFSSFLLGRKRGKRKNAGESVLKAQSKIRVF